ncbi:MAG: hypothetical protein M1832_002493 [Thelocarpon impressellum]|nr:MAG: hypothetical protein M1832_002493 [Thelocarpon impressellum]
MADGSDPSRRSYGAHQVDIYVAGMLHHRIAVARRHLGARSFSYVAGGAGERATMDANRLAFRR